MRSLIATVLLLLVAAALYAGTIGGESGVARTAPQSGARISATIQRVDP